jgi:hypothetical protein
MPVHLAIALFARGLLQSRGMGCGPSLEHQITDWGIFYIFYTLLESVCIFMMQPHEATLDSTLTAQRSQVTVSL